MNFTKEDLGGKNPQFYSKRNCLWCNKEFVFRIKTNAKFCCAKCSSLHAARNTDSFEKAKSTKLKKYGSATYTNIEKMKQTCLDKYGVDNASKSKEVIDKIKQVNLAKYGVECSFQAKEVKDKIKETLIERYGVDHPTKSQEIRDKVKATCMERYGVENPFESDEFKEKSKQTCLTKYGVEYPIQSQEIRDKIRQDSLESLYPVVRERLNKKSNCEPLFTKDEYNGTDKKFEYKFKCKHCGNVFLSHIDGGHLPRCQICYPLNKSIEQAEILDFIKSICSDDEKIIENTRSVLKSGKEIDIYLPNKQIGIEYDSFYFHGENSAEKSHKYHLDKTVDAENLGIKLMHIFEDEWFNKKEIIKSKLKSIISPDKTSTVFARKLLIKQIDYTEFSAFVEEYHIQGTIPCTIYLGAFLKDELIGVSSFSYPRISLGGAVSNENNKMELVRYATKQRVIGLCSKFLAHLKKLQSKIESVYSYADRRFTSRIGNLYQKSGFILESESDPNYWYFKNGYHIRYHRYGFRKSELHKKLDIFDPNLSEWENMKRNDYDRIWDCGNLKFVHHFDK